jgi:hypothetical protein
MVSRIGIVYPLLPEHLQRIFDGKDVFCKFFPGLGKPKIHVGDKVLFYSSGGDYEIRGEATISSLEYSALDQTVRKYEKRLFITPKELNRYAAKRKRPPGKKLMVIVMREIRKYPKPYRLEKPIPMSGIILTEGMYERITSVAK